jgi:hypothetical protein
VDKEIKTVAKAVINHLAKHPSASAWELKMALKVTHTRLHLALGVLLGQEKITLRSDKLTFIVEAAAPANMSEETSAPAEKAVA